MALSAKLQARQTQALVMTPQLMQSIRLLQLTRQELDRFIDAEMERNPLLERDEAEAAIAASEPVAEGDVEPADGEDWFADEIAPSAAMSETFDASLDNVFPDDPGVRDGVSPDLLNNWKSAGTGGTLNFRSADGFDLEDVTAAATTLRGHVEEQIALTRFSPGERLIALELADQLDDAGYMGGDTAEIARRLGVEEDAVLSLLEILQTFDPAGLFARNVAECLAIQLRRKDRFDPAMQAMVENLELLAKRDFATLKKLCGVGEDDILDMLAEIRALDPKPGTAFSSAPAEPVFPDVIVSAAPDGSWAIDINPDALPRVLVNQAYHTRVRRLARTAAEKDFMSECLQSANWLVRSLDQRARTILKVTAEIVRQQDAFLIHGVSQLRPLTLKAVADAIKMHESTVSRVTSNKYVMTPRGIFELRYFFTVAIASADGAPAHSAEAVKHRIRDLIGAEMPSKVLSDDAIVEILQASGVDIARRTVAKYREGMNIASSVQRRREKKAFDRLEA